MQHAFLGHPFLSRNSQNYYWLSAVITPSSAAEGSKR